MNFRWYRNLTGVANEPPQNCAPIFNRMERLDHEVADLMNLGIKNPPTEITERGNLGFLSTYVTKVGSTAPKGSVSIILNHSGGAQRKLLKG